MKEKIKIICLILITISILVVAKAYALRTLIDIGCSSPKFYSFKDTGSERDKFLSREFLGIKCYSWNRVVQIQENY